MKHELQYHTETNYTCLLCGCTEEYITTECRGEQLDSTIYKMIAMGQMDYVDGNWIRPNVKEDLSFK